MSSEDTKDEAPESCVPCGPLPVPTVSMGSVGHPYTCAEACKYVMKKNRGCKDGAACNRCHLCEWKKRGPRRSKETHPAEPEQSEQTKKALVLDEHVPEVTKPSPTCDTKSTSLKDGELDTLLQDLQPEQVKKIEQTCQE